MEKELKNLLEHFREVSEEKHNEGANQRNISDRLSEWNYGFSEGLDYAIEQLNLIIKTD